LTVENAQRFTTFHPRCGTSFLMLLMIVSMLVYPFIPFDGFAARLLMRIALLAADRRRQLRADPLRRPAARRVSGGAHRSRPVAPAHHHPAALG